MRPFRIGLFVIGTVLILGACGDSQTDGEEPDTEGSDTSTVMADSMDAAQPPAPPPGTVKTRGTVLSCNRESPRICEIRIGEVIGYGPSTPSVTTGKRTVSLRPAVLQEWTMEDLLAGRMKTLTLRHAGDKPQLGDTSESASPQWALTEVSK